MLEVSQDVLNGTICTNPAASIAKMQQFSGVNGMKAYGRIRFSDTGKRATFVRVPDEASKVEAMRDLLDNPPK